MTPAETTEEPLAASSASARGGAAAQANFLTRRGVACESKFATAPDGYSLHYVTCGSPQQLALVFTHGSAGNCCSWWQNLPMFAEESLFCIAMDLRFFGSSAPITPALLQDFSGGATHAQDVIAVLDAEGVDRAIIFCQSMGGCVGVHAAAAFPSRVAGLAMCCTNRGIERDEEDQRLSDVGLFRPALQWPEEFPMKGLHPKFQEERPDMVELFLEVKGFNSAVPSEVEKACQDNPVALERVAQLDVPMLMLSADYDWFFSRAMLSRSAQHCRNCTFVQCDGHGHSVYFENPSLFHKTAVEWMRGAGIR